MAAVARWSLECDLPGKSRKNEVVTKARELPRSLAFVFPLIGARRPPARHELPFMWLDKVRLLRINLFADMHKPILESRSNESRRHFLKGTAIFSALALARRAEGTSTAMHEDGSGALPPAFSELKSLGTPGYPITADEFPERLLHAQKLIIELTPKYDALFVTPGTSLYYFTGIRWGGSERLLAVELPRAGDPIVAVPGFDEGRMRESLHFAAYARAWQQDENPTKTAAEGVAH